MTEARRMGIALLGRPGVILSLFILLGAGIYWNALENGFHYDDHHHILQNPLIKTPANIPFYFTDPRAFSLDSQIMKHYRPMILSSYSINYALGEFAPWGYHLVNLGFHVGGAFLLFLILRAMPIGGDFLATWIPPAAGLLFLTTPFNTEAVNYISARSSVMAAFFYLLSFWCWIRYRVRSAPRYLVVSLAAFLFAMLTKESAITLPILLFVHDRYFSRVSGEKGRVRFDPRSYIPYLPFVLIAGGIGILVRFFFFDGILSGAVSRGILEQALTETRVVSRYLLMPFAPTGLNLEHGVTVSSSVDGWVLFSTLFLLAVIGLTYWLGRRVDPAARIVSFFLVWFFVTLLPITVTPLLAIFQENRGYLSTAGIAVVAGVALIEGVRRLPLSGNAGIGAAGGILFVLVAIQSWGVVERNPVWRDDFTLWSDVLQKNSRSANAHVELGVHYALSGDAPGAEREFLAALSVDPRESHALNNLGLLYARKGEMEKAKRTWEEVLRYYPANPKARQNLAMLQMGGGDLEQAKENLVRVMAVQSTNPAVVRQLLVGIYERQGNFDAARGWLTELLRKDPHNPALHFGIGLIYKKDREFPKAKEAFLTVLRKIPRDSTTLLELAVVYSELGQSGEAERILEGVRQLDPENPQVHQALGLHYQATGRVDLAIVAYEKVLSLQPGSFRTLNNLGGIYYRSGNWKKAEDYLKQALSVNPADVGVHYNLAAVYESSGESSKARREYTWVVENAPDTSSYLRLKQEAVRHLAAL